MDLPSGEPQPHSLTILANTPALWAAAIRKPPLDAHKYRRGHVLVASGPEFMTGAARLSAWAAVRAGVGAVTLVGDAAALRIHAAHVTAIMLREAADAEAFGRWLDLSTASALAIGPGAGVMDLTADRLAQLFQRRLPTVVDADAISVMGERPGLRPTPDHPLVLTPHEGEFARLFHNCGSREERAAAAAREIGATVLLKGERTVIASPDGRVAINETGGVELATAGSGDVLTGVIASHLAQGMPPFEAACAGAWLHGMTGRALGYGLDAEQLAHAIRPLQTVQLA